MSEKQKNDYNYRLHASVVKFLIDGGETEAAAALLSCSLKAYPRMVSGNKRDQEFVEVYLIGSRAVYDAFYENNSPLRATLMRAFGAFVDGIDGITVKAGLLDIDDPNWKQMLHDLLTGKTTANQGIESEKSEHRQFWNGLHFSTAEEVEIAKVLDQQGVLFFPGAMARIGTAENRLNRQPDFLICYHSKWGILEIDSELETPTNGERDQLFKNQGVVAVEHINAAFCREQPDQVVAEFLALLERA